MEEKEEEEREGKGEEEVEDAESEDVAGRGDGGRASAGGGVGEGVDDGLDFEWLKRASVERSRSSENVEEKVVDEGGGDREEQSIISACVSERALGALLFALTMLGGVEASVRQGPSSRRVPEGKRSHSGGVGRGVRGPHCG